MTANYIPNADFEALASALHAADDLNAIKILLVDRANIVPESIRHLDEAAEAAARKFDHTPVIDAADKLAQAFGGIVERDGRGRPVRIDLDATEVRA